MKLQTYPCFLLLVSLTFLHNSEDANISVISQVEKKKKKANGIRIRGCIWYLEVLTSNGCEDCDPSSLTVTNT